MAEDYDDSEYDEFEFHGTAFNMGLGTGISLNTRQLLKKEKGNFHLDFGINLHFGTRSNYRNINKEDSAISNLDQGDYQSLTHYIAYRFGVLFEL